MDSPNIFTAVEVFGVPTAPPIVVRSPGRVNLIGDHIDYSGGLVFPMALDRGTTAVVFPRQDTRIRGYSANFTRRGVVGADLDNTAFDPRHEWFSYVLAVVATAAGEGLRIPTGFDICLSGDIPEGGGLSSSASVELSVAVALEEMFGFGLDPTRWALLCQRAENGYIGVACGIMDQLAIARGRDGMAIVMDCESLECDFVPLPRDKCTVLVANTNYPRQLADSAYNDRRMAVEAAAVIIEELRGRALGNLVQVTQAELAEYAGQLETAGVLAFARHTVTEQARVVAAAAALRAGDVDSFGRLMRESHESLRDDFKVTGPHLDALAEAAWSTPGVIGARMTGAGFGGCTVNLVEAGREDAASAEIASKYREATGVTTDIFPVLPSQGAHVVREPEPPSDGPG